MDGGGKETLEGSEELGMDVKDNGAEEHQPTGLGDVFHGGGAVGTPIRVGYMGDKLPHGKGPGGFPAQS